MCMVLTVKGGYWKTRRRQHVTTHGNILLWTPTQANRITRQ